MKFVTIIFFVAIATYNLQDEQANYVVINLLGGEVYVWRFIYHFFFDLVLLVAFYELRRKSVIYHERRIYLCGMLFMCFYTIFNLSTLLSPTISSYLAKTNSTIWGTVSATMILFFLSSLLLKSKA